MKFKLIENILDTIEFNGKDKDYLGDVSGEIAAELYSMLSELIEEDTDITDVVAVSFHQTSRKDK